MTIQQIKSLRSKVTNPQVLEALELALKYKQLVPSLEVIKNIRIKKLQSKIFKTGAAKQKLKIEVSLLDELIKNLGENESIL